MRYAVSMCPPPPRIGTACEPLLPGIAGGADVCGGASVAVPVENPTCLLG